MSFDAGAIVGSLQLNISPFAQGMLQAESIAKLFPAVVTNFMANPLLGLVGIAETAAHGIEHAFSHVAALVKESLSHTSESMHALGIEAERAGVSAQFLGAIGAAAKEVHVDID